jgi:hypothetical protein
MLLTITKGLFEQLPARLKNSGVTSGSGKKKRSAPSPTPVGSQGVRSAPDLSQPESGSMGGIARAATFPIPTSMQTKNLSKGAYDDNRFQSNTLSTPNLRQSFHELVSPTEVSTVGTPDSSSTGNSIQQQQYNLQQRFGVNNALPDLSAMMFPSADPFAYPNQPMMEFDNIKQENIGDNMLNGQPRPNNYAPSVYDDLEGQLFGPIPPYLMQGQPNFDVGAAAQMDTGMSGLNPQQMNFQTGVTPNGEINFDGIFSGDSDDWGNMMADQRFRQ